MDPFLCIVALCGSFPMAWFKQKKCSIGLNQQTILTLLEECSEMVIEEFGNSGKGILFLVFSK